MGNDIWPGRLSCFKRACQRNGEDLWEALDYEWDWGISRESSMTWKALDRRLEELDQGLRTGREGDAVRFELTP